MANPEKLVTLGTQDTGWRQTKQQQQKEKPPKNQHKTTQKTKTVINLDTQNTKVDPGAAEG